MKEAEPTDATPKIAKQRALERWENEGGEIPNVPTPQPAETSAVRSPRKKLFVFDLDGTLAESKAALDAEMAALLTTLLGQVKVAVISGGDWPQFESQLLANLSPDANLKNLSLLPTCGTKFYQFDSDWQQLYADDLTKAEKEEIVRSLEEAVGAEDGGKLGIDKAYGIKKLQEILGIELEEMLFAGAALFPGGNDYPVKEAGVVSIQVNNAEETKRVIETFLAS